MHLSQELKRLVLAKTNITIVEFGDYQCPYCAKFNNETKNNLTDNYIDKGIAKFIFKDLIINDLPKDRLSSLAAEVLIVQLNKIDIGHIMMNFIIIIKEKILGGFQKLL